LKETVPATSPTDKTARAVAEMISAAERFILTCHTKPDGDALGSMLALGLALKEAGREVVLYTEDPVPENLDFLPGSGYVTNEVPVTAGSKTTLVVMDCSEVRRIGRDAETLIGRASSIVILDHHLSRAPFLGHLDRPERWRCVSWILPEVFATGALVYWLLEGLGWPISKGIATNLYAAILSDTGSFRHSNTTRTTFQMAARLVDLGADPYAVADRLYQRYPRRRQQLLGLVLKTLEVKAQGTVGVIQATPEMFKVSQATENDTEEFVGYVRCIDTVEVAIFIKEARAGQVSVSLRSKSDFNVAELAQEFGGGGHFHAAGFRKTGTAPEMRALLLERLSSYSKRLGTVNV
jgi:phosphoesterase RecJ-like protein